MRRRRFVALAAAAGSAAVAGCGDASDVPGSESTDRAEGQQQLGEQGTAAGGNGTASEQSTAEETPEESSTETEPEAPEETGTETQTATPGSESGAAQGSVEYPEESVAVRDVEYDPNSGEDAGPTVTGVVENVSGEALSYVEVRVTAYGEDDEQLGDALDDTTDLGDGETWEFNCELWDTDPEAVESWTGEVAVSRQYDESSRTPGSP